MKQIVTAFVLLVTCVGTALASNPVRISQVYAAGGNGGSGIGAAYAYDYVELFNASNVPVNVGGWSLQYGGGTNLGDLGTCTDCLTVLYGSIQPCGYYLVRLAKGSTQPYPTNDLPVVPDASGATDLDPTGGTIALRSSTTTGPCGNQFDPVVDEVGWGSTSCKEGSAVGTLFDPAAGAVRNGGGLVDTDNNALDFTIVSNPVPHNSQSAPNPDCTAQYNCQVGGWSPDPVCPGAQLSIFGSQFPANAQVTLVNWSTSTPYPLAMVYVSPGILTGVVPTNAPAGQYGFFVSPGNCNSGTLYVTVGSANCPTPAAPKSWGFVKSIYR